MLDDLQLTNKERQSLNDWVGFLSFKPTWAFNQFVNWDSKIICLFTGNQGMKTSGAAMYNVLSILGMLPIKSKNINPDDAVRVLRFASETLPMDTTGNEVRNTQYPEFKKWLPPSLIKKDITARNPVMTIKCPRGGPDILVEFNSFNQEVQAQAGVQRRRVWIDEHCKKAFYEEQLPRLLAANGDMIVTLTPAQEYLDWEYDEFYERAHKIIRTPSVIDRIKKRQGVDAKDVEITNNKPGITIIMAATDDNPIMDKETIEQTYMMLGDEDIVDIRRYGLFKQISGRIFKQFDKNIHIINRNMYFPKGMPTDWVHARGIDYHELNPWAVGWCCLSDTDEMFIYDEYNPSPQNMVTYDIMKNIALRHSDNKFVLNLVDPLANKKQPNTGYSVLEDMNNYFRLLRRNDEIGQFYSWDTWDTKSQTGVDKIKMRLNNSVICKKPFNNLVRMNGKDMRLPTLWILDNCRITVESFNQWRKEEWASRDALLVKDSKDKAQQKFSHFPMVFDGIIKSPVFDVKRFFGGIQHNRNRNPYRNMFRGN
jgi:phage terminase large subunit-like protein